MGRFYFTSATSKTTREWRRISSLMRPLMDLPRHLFAIFTSCLTCPTKRRTSLITTGKRANVFILNALLLEVPWLKKKFKIFKSGFHMSSFIGDALRSVFGDRRRRWFYWINKTFFSQFKDIFRKISLNCDFMHQWLPTTDIPRWNTAYESQV